MRVGHFAGGYGARRQESLAKIKGNRRSVHVVAIDLLPFDFLAEKQFSERDAFPADRYGSKIDGASGVKGLQCLFRERFESTLSDCRDQLFVAANVIGERYRVPVEVAELEAIELAERDEVHANVQGKIVVTVYFVPRHFLGEKDVPAGNACPVSSSSAIAAVSSSRRT